MKKPTMPTQRWHRLLARCVLSCFVSWF